MFNDVLIRNLDDTAAADDRLCPPQPSARPAPAPALAPGGAVAGGAPGPAPAADTLWCKLDVRASDPVPTVRFHAVSSVWRDLMVLYGGRPVRFPRNAYGHTTIQRLNAACCISFTLAWVAHTFAHKFVVCCCDPFAAGAAEYLSYLSLGYLLDIHYQGSYSSVEFDS